MKRLTTDDANSICFGLNLFFVKDREVWIRGGGPEPDYQDCTLTDWINRAAAAQGIELGADDAESLGDIMYDCLQFGVTPLRASWRYSMRQQSKQRRCVAVWLLSRTFSATTTTWIGCES